MKREYEDQKERTSNIHDICDRLESLGVSATALVKIRREANMRLAKVYNTLIPSSSGFGGSVWCSKCSVMTTPSRQCKCTETGERRRSYLSSVPLVLATFIAFTFVACQGNPAGDRNEAFDSCTGSERIVADSLVHACVLRGGEVDVCNEFAAFQACGDTVFNRQPDDTDNCYYGTILHIVDEPCYGDSTKVIATVSICTSKLDLCAPKEAFNGEKRRFCNTNSRSLCK